MTQDKTILNFVTQEINEILLNSAFGCDRICSDDKISEILTFPDDINGIKKTIEKRLNIRIASPIANMTAGELHILATGLFTESGQKVKFRKDPMPEQPVHSISRTQQIEQEPLWNRRIIFGYILKHIRSMFDRNIKSTEKIRDLMLEYRSTHCDTLVFCGKLAELEEFFGIKIDQEMRLYNVCNAAEKSFVAQGKAFDSKVSDESKDPLWRCITTIVSMRYLKSVIENEYQIHLSLDRLSNTASYAELEKLVAEARRKKMEKAK